METKSGVEEPRFVKFIVTGWLGGKAGEQVPCTGIDLALRLAKDWLSVGHTVEIVPFTREQWAAMGKQIGL